MRATDIPAPEQRTLKVYVRGMACRHCVRDTTRRLRDVPGIQTVTADAAASLVILSGSMTLDDVRAALAGSEHVIEEVPGAEASPVSEGGASNDD